MPTRYFKRKRNMALVLRVNNDEPSGFEVAEEYEPINTFSQYSPWNRDWPFLEIYQYIRPFSFVDIYKCYELWQMVEQSAKLDEGDIIEVGTWRGGSGVLMARKAMLCNIPGNVYLCDTFKGIVKAGEHDPYYWNGRHDDTYIECVQFLAAKTKLDNVKILEGVFPDETGQEVSDHKFRLCHIDVDVYQSAKDAADWIWDRLVPGGSIVYDDYGCKECLGITKYVEEQMNLKDRIVFYNLNGHAITVKL